jgi:hypothetical protein
MQHMRTVQTQEAMEATLRVWRTAAQVVATDPLVARQHAYEEAIAHLCKEMPRFTRLQELIDYAWSAELTAIAAITSLGQRGRVLNHHVVAAAACWRHLQHLLATHGMLEEDSLSIEE